MTPKGFCLFFFKGLWCHCALIAPIETRLAGSYSGERLARLRQSRLDLSQRITSWTLIIEWHYKFTPLDGYQARPIVVVGLARPHYRQLQAA